MSLQTRLTQDYALFEMKGADSRDFLHRLTTADVRNLQPGESTSGFFLEATGKIRAFFHLFCEASDRFLLLTPKGENESWKTALLAVMDQFTFAEKYELKESSDWTVYEALGGPLEEKTVAIRLSPEASLILVPASASHLPQATPLTDEVWEKARISALIPKVDHELTLTVNPLEIGLKSAIADQKGCYPGQEVIEKIISLGAPAKRLVLLRGTGPAPASKSPVVTTAEPAQQAGEVTSSVSSSDGSFVALALVRKVHAKEDLSVRFEAAPSSVARIERLSSYDSAP